MVEGQGPTGEDLAQIREKDYAAKYRRPGITVYCVGVEFDKESRNIVGFEWQRYDAGPRSWRRGVLPTC